MSTASFAASCLSEYPLVDHLEIVTRRPSALPPTVAVPIRIEILRADRDLSEATLVTKDFEAAADGKSRIRG